MKMSIIKDVRNLRTWAALGPGEIAIHDGDPYIRLKSHRGELVDFGAVRCPDNCVAGFNLVTSTVRFFGDDEPVATPRGAALTIEI